MGKLNYSKSAHNCAAPHIIDTDVNDWHSVKSRGIILKLAMIITWACYYSFQKQDLWNILWEDNRNEVGVANYSWWG